MVRGGDPNGRQLPSMRRDGTGAVMIDGIRELFSGGLLTDADDMAPYLIDWRQTWRGVALAVVQPDTVDDVASVVRWCAGNDVAIVPQGGNTGQSGGSVPRATGRNIVLSLTRLNTIRAIDPVNNSMTVDAGCILQTVQDAADAAGRLFPLSLGAEGSCTIGGTLATNAGGTAVLRHGSMRDLCLGLEVVTAAGDVWNGLKALRKDNSGYDLRDLFIGSEGTLGVITGAVLKLVPKPAARLVALAAVAMCDDAMALFAAFRARCDTGLTAFELMSDVALGMVLDHIPAARMPLARPSPWYILIELTDRTSEANLRATMEAGLSEALASGIIADAVIADSVAQARALWLLRDSVSAGQGAAGRAIKHDIAVPVGAIAPFVGEAIAAVTSAYPAIRPVIFGHLGDGNLHFNFSSAPGADQDAFFAEQGRINRIVHDIVRRYDGTISAEHGLGVLRRDEAHEFRSPVERQLMAAIKTALDPQGIMNPEKLLG